MTNINILNNKLEKLNLQMIQTKDINNISLHQFLKQKNLLKQQLKLNKKISKIRHQEQKINFIYESNTKSWIENPKINCRKFYKLDQKALYKKDLQLYKLGITTKKPISPIIMKISKFIKPIFTSISFMSKKLISKLSKITIFNKLIKNLKIFKEQILPNQINNMAVNIATTVLKGYRELQYNYRFIRNNLKSKNSVKYLHTILEQANQRIIDSSNSGNTHINSNDFDNLHINSDAINNLHVNPNDISKKELNFNNSIKNKFPKISFRESLKPENFNSTHQNLSQHSKPIKKITLDNIYLTK